MYVHLFQLPSATKIRQAEQRSESSWLGFELDDQGKVVRFPTASYDSSIFENVHTGREAYPSSYSKGYRGVFTRAKRPMCEAPSCAEVQKA